MNEKTRLIQVVPYDPSWPAEFEKEASAISCALGTLVVHVHHIGSTAVPDLKAKPVIDILLEVTDVNALDAHDTGMKSLGYTPKGEFGIPGRRFYLKGLYDRTHHIHAFDAGSSHMERHIAFRDYLIAHPLIAKNYEELKVRCAAECESDNDKYCDGKDAFVREHEQRAEEWMKCQQAVARDG